MFSSNDFRTGKTALGVRRRSPGAPGHSSRRNPEPFGIDRHSLHIFGGRGGEHETEQFFVDREPPKEPGSRCNQDVAYPSFRARSPQLQPTPRRHLLYKANYGRSVRRFLLRDGDSSIYSGNSALITSIIDSVPERCLRKASAAEFGSPDAMASISA